MTITRLLPVTALCAVCFLSLSSASTAQDARVLHARSGSGPGHALGEGSFVGDVNADGVPDLAVAEPSFSTSDADNLGRVQLLDGKSFAPLWEFVGDIAGGMAGASLAPLTDIDADGVPDLAVGAPGRAGLPLTGRVYVLSGADGTLLHSHLGATPGGHYGWSVAGMPDLDADGRSELIIGAPFEDANGKNSGSVSIVDPLDGELLHQELGGEEDRLGSSVTGGAGDLAAGPWSAGDGPTPTIGWHDGWHDDALVSLTWNAEPHPTFGATQTPGTGRGMLLQLKPDGSSMQLRAGEKADDRYGAELSEMGDLDGDGVPELLVFTDPRTDQGHATGEGYTEIIDRKSAMVERRAVGQVLGNSFGITGAGPGDVNGDGVLDYVIAESHDDSSGLDAGRVVVFSGADNSVLAELTGAKDGDHYGRQVFSVGDLDGDGLADFGVGAPGHDEGRGRVEIITLSPWANAGPGLAGAGGVPALRGHGGLVAGRDVTLLMEGAAPLAVVSLVYGTKLETDAQGELVPAAEAIVSNLTTDGLGRVSHGLSWPSDIAPGTTTYFQYQVLDPVSGTLSRSPILSGTTR